jgi:sigma-B regulation protein RsbU (phosphoserine phosphatase)
MTDPTRPADAGTRQALASREQELRTLLELSQAFGRDLDRDAILTRLGYALRGQMLVGRAAAFLRTPGGLVAVSSTPGSGVALPDVPLALADLDRPAVLDAGPLRDAGFAVAVPLRAGSVSRGVVLLGPRASGGAPDASAFDFAAALAALAVGALETADRVADRVADEVARESAREEMRLAREIQRGLLPRSLPAVPGLDVAVRWRPSAAVSGDTYDAAALPDGRLVVAVADVVGKGIPAALLTSTVQAGLRLLRPDGQDAGAALARATQRLNRLIADSTEPHQFATLAWAVVDPTSGRVWSVAAGHPAPRIRRADGSVEALTAGGPLLGVVPGARFGCAEATLAPGDTLVLFSDGLTESLDAAGEEWGEAGLDAALPLGPDATADALLGNLVAASDAFAGPTNGAAHDDLTAIAVRLTGVP